MLLLSSHRLIFLVSVAIFVLSISSLSTVQVMRSSTRKTIGIRPSKKMATLKMTITEDSKIPSPVFGVNSKKESVISRNDFATFFEIITGVGAAGGGQLHSGRDVLHATGAKRTWTDPMMWTHVFLATGAVVSYTKGMYDMFLLLAVTTPLSILYHLTYEKPGTLAKVEGICAKLLYAYGTAQIFYAPNFELLTFEIFMMLCTTALFFVTNVRGALYDKYHHLMHVIPSGWAVIVALFHRPLFVVPFFI